MCILLYSGDNMISLYDSCIYDYVLPLQTLVEHYVVAVATSPIPRRSAIIAKVIAHSFLQFLVITVVIPLLSV